MGKRGSTPQRSAESFIVAWQQSSSVREVADKLGLNLGAAYERARDYRSRGIALKRHARSGRPQLDVDALKKLAKAEEPK